MTPDPGPGDPHDVTLVEVLSELESIGYDVDFFVDENDGHVRCGVCRVSRAPAEVELDSLRRLEGASDPGDMTAVLALRCPRCGSRGTAVVRFGPEATAGEAALLQHLDDDRDDGLDLTENAAT